MQTYIHVPFILDLLAASIGFMEKILNTIYDRTNIIGLDFLLDFFRRIFLKNKSQINFRVHVNGGLVFRALFRPRLSLILVWYNDLSSHTAHTRTYSVWKNSLKTFYYRGKNSIACNHTKECVCMDLNYIVLDGV